MSVSLLSALAWLAVAMILAGAGLWLRRSTAPSGMKVIARLPIEPRRALLVVEVAGRILLLSSSEAGVSMLVELDPSATASFASPRDQAAGPWALLLPRRS